MAEKKKQKKERFLSGRGVAVYPRLDGKPDTKFDKAGIYSVRLAKEGEEAEALKEKIDGWMEESLDEAQKAEPTKAKKMQLSDPPYKIEYNKDKDGNDIEDEPTGRILFNFKMKASGERQDGTKWTSRPAIFDAKGVPLTTSRIGGGSEINVSYSINKFSMLIQGSGGKIGCGVSLQLQAVQVLKYVEYNGGDAKSFGFGEEEGFTQEGEATAAVTNAEPETEEVEETKTPAKGKKASAPADEF